LLISNRRSPYGAPTSHAPGRKNFRFRGPGGDNHGDKFSWPWQPAEDGQDAPPGVFSTPKHLGSRAPHLYTEPERQLAWGALAAPPAPARPRASGSRLAMHRVCANTAGLCTPSAAVLQCITALPPPPPKLPWDGGIRSAQLPRPCRWPLAGCAAAIKRGKGQRQRQLFWEEGDKSLSTSCSRWGRAVGSPQMTAPGRGVATSKQPAWNSNQGPVGPCRPPLPRPAGPTKHGPSPPGGASSRRTTSA
jgi:hypothetical protein